MLFVNKKKVGVCYKESKTFRFQQILNNIVCFCELDQIAFIFRTPNKSNYTACLLVLTPDSAPLLLIEYLIMPALPP